MDDEQTSPWSDDDQVTAPDGSNSDVDPEIDGDDLDDEEESLYDSDDLEV